MAPRMKWPWVTYGTVHQLMLEAVKGVHESWREDRTAMQARYDDLLDKYHALKLSGAVLPDEPPEPLPDQPKREPTIVSQVIREQSGGDPRLAAHLRTYAGKLKREGADENQIAYALGQWVSTEPETQVI